MNIVLPKYLLYYSECNSFDDINQVESFLPLWKVQCQDSPELFETFRSMVSHIFKYHVFVRKVLSSFVVSSLWGASQKETKLPFCFRNMKLVWWWSFPFLFPVCPFFISYVSVLDVPIMIASGCCTAVKYSDCVSIWWY